MLKKIILLVIVVALIATAHAAIIPDVRPIGGAPMVSIPAVQSPQEGFAFASGSVVSDSVSALRGNISVNSNPTGARIWVGTRYSGKRTPALIKFVTPGTHMVTLRLPGYTPYVTSVMVTEGETTMVTAELVPLAGTGKIFFRSNPRAAKIFLDGVDTGKITPANLTNVNAGQHTVSLLITTNLTVIPGKRTTVIGTLSKK